MPAGADSAVNVALDEASLTAILDNLVKNAIEAMPKGGIIKLNWTSDSEDVIIEVADNGPGLPSAVVHGLQSGGRITSTKTGGNGLGLLSVRDTLASSRRRTHRIHHNRNDMVPNSSTSDRSRSSGGELSTAQSRFRILVADDQIDVARTLCNTLQAHGALFDLCVRWRASMRSNRSRDVSSAHNGYENATGRMGGTLAAKGTPRSPLEGSRPSALRRGDKKTGN